MVIVKPAGCFKTGLNLRPFTSVISLKCQFGFFAFLYFCSGCILRFCAMGGFEFTQVDGTIEQFNLHCKTKEWIWTRFAVWFDSDTKMNDWIWILDLDCFFIPGCNSKIRIRMDSFPFFFVCSCPYFNMDLYMEMHLYWGLLRLFFCSTEYPKRNPANSGIIIPDPTVACLHYTPVPIYPHAKWIR